eukprot:jgi/Botrbrau1/7958/Bobra.9_2s0114.2
MMARRSQFAIEMATKGFAVQILSRDRERLAQIYSSIENLDPLLRISLFSKVWTLLFENEDLLLSKRFIAMYILRSCGSGVQNPFHKFLIVRATASRNSVERRFVTELLRDDTFMQKVGVMTSQEILEIYQQTLPVPAEVHNKQGDHHFEGLRKAGGLSGPGARPLNINQPFLSYMAVGSTIYNHSTQKDRATRSKDIEASSDRHMQNSSSSPRKAPRARVKQKAPPGFADGNKDGGPGADSKQPDSKAADLLGNGVVSKQGVPAAPGDALCISDPKPPQPQVAPPTELHADLKEAIDTPLFDGKKKQLIDNLKKWGSKLVDDAGIGPDHLSSLISSNPSVAAQVIVCMISQESGKSRDGWEEALLNARISTMKIETFHLAIQLAKFSEVLMSRFFCGLADQFKGLPLTGNTRIVKLTANLFKKCLEEQCQLEQSDCCFVMQAFFLSHCGIHEAADAYKAVCQRMDQASRAA